MSRHVEAVGSERFRAGPFARSVLPDYSGLGITNLPATIERHFGLDPAMPSLSPEALPPELLEGVEVVVTLVVDALGYRGFTEAMERGYAPNLLELSRRDGSLLSCLTSTFPSATPIALTTLGTGLPPSQHGVIGDKIYDSELGEIVRPLTFSTVPDVRPLEALGVDPISWVGLATIYQRLAVAGVGGVVINHAEYEGTALSRINHGGARFIGFQSLPDMCVSLRSVLQSISGRTYVHAYWGVLDAISHTYGVDSPQYRAELHSLDYVLERILLRGLRTRHTLLLILADHGQIDTTAGRWTWLNDHPELLEMLEHAPTGDHRAVLLHVRNGLEPRAKEYLDENLDYCARTITAEEALDLEIFGPGPMPERVRERVGDLIVLPREEWVVRYEFPGVERRRWHMGTHGGVSEEEMLVPLLSVRLD